MEFPDVFAEPTYPVEGRSIEHKILLKSDAEIPPRKLYPLSSDELAELKK